jgi:fatty acid desaturase
MKQQSIRTYLKSVQGDMPENAFERVPSRLLWLPFHLIVISLCAHEILVGSPSLGLTMILSLVIGHSYGCLMFVGHELTHDTMIGRSWFHTFCGWLCFLPYCIGPDQWRTWHNHWHHRNTSLTTLDPDSWGSIASYWRRSDYRFVEKLSPGSGCWQSIPYLFYWFSAQGFLVMVLFSRLLHFWEPNERRKVWFQVLSGVAFWIGLFAVVGWNSFLWIYILPMLLANFIQMSYIATNHLLMPETKSANDPLINSLTVSTIKILDIFHLNFSHHTEHHVCPAMSGKYAPAMKQILKEKYPERYKELPHWKAVKKLYDAPKLHWNERHFVNPRTGGIFEAIYDDFDLSLIGKVPSPIERQPMKEATEAQGFEPVS